MLKKYKTIIFDLDGTIIDGTKGIFSSLTKTFIKLKLSVPNKEILTKFLGPPLQLTCKNELKMTEEESTFFVKTFRNYYINGDIYDANIYEGIKELFIWLKNNSYKIGIATYKREDLAIDLMKHLGFDKYFDSICGADNENKLKKIDILKNCMSDLEAEKETTILIGDSYHDGVAAKELGVGFIGVTYGVGFKTKEEVAGYHPILVAEKVNEIIDYFERK